MSPTAPGAPIVGIVGAGQLARMTYQAAIALGLSPRILAARPDDGAALVAREVAIGAPDAVEALAGLAGRCDVVTFDHELVDVAQLELLAAGGACFRPSPTVVALAQDKRRQREQFGALGLPIPAWRPAATLDELLDFGSQHGWPVVAKARRGGYDGRGVWVVDGPEAAGRVHAEAAARGLELLAEELVPLDREVAILVARRPSGEARAYPLVETVQVEGICREVLAPARVPRRLEDEACELALRVARACEVVGILAVELFVAGGRLLVNEVAARPHNSGHYSIEGCVTSQFENHVRAVLDWPLGSTELSGPAVATVNVLGAAGSAELHANLPRALDVDGAHVHLYGKSARPGRKLGHVTVVGSSQEEALARAGRAAGLLVAPALAEVRR